MEVEEVELFQYDGVKGKFIIRLFHVHVLCVIVSLLVLYDGIRMLINGKALITIFILNFSINLLV